MGHQIWNIGYICLVFMMRFVLLYVDTIPKNIIEHEKHGIRRQPVMHTCESGLILHGITSINRIVKQLT